MGSRYRGFTTFTSESDIPQEVLNRFNVRVYISKNDYPRINPKYVWSDTIKSSTIENQNMLKKKIVSWRNRANRFNAKLSTANYTPSVAVFDLDDTLVDKVGTPYVGAGSFLNAVQKRVDFMVLWSHGTTAHVRSILADNNWGKYFNLVIARSPTEQQVQNKGIGFVLSALNAKFGISRLGTTYLFDDLSDNYTADYEHFVFIPEITRNTNTLQLYQFLYARLFSCIK